MKQVTSVAAMAFLSPPVWAGEGEHPYLQPSFPVLLPTLGCLFLKRCVVVEEKLNYQLY